MSEADVETLLRSALRPVEPSLGLRDRLENRLRGVRDAAADELADWELKALRDPRRWLRAVIALVAGGAAATALALLRWQHARRSRPRGARRVVSAAAARAASLRRLARAARRHS